MFSSRLELALSTFVSLVIPIREASWFFCGVRDKTLMNSIQCLDPRINCLEDTGDFKVADEVAFGRSAIIETGPLGSVEFTRNFQYGFSHGKFTISEGRSVGDILIDPFHHLESTANGKGVRHIAYLEKTLRATMPGGFFCAVLPSNWMQRTTKFLRWVTPKMAEVARIELPRTVGNQQEDDCVTQFLYVFHRSFDVESDNIREAEAMEFAQHRFPSFSARLYSPTHGEIERVASDFAKTKWSLYTVKMFAKFMASHRYHNRYGFVSSPRSLCKGDRFYCFPTQSLLEIVPQDQLSKRMEIEADLVQIIPKKRSTRIVASSYFAHGRLLELLDRHGLEKAQDEESPSWAFEKNLEGHLSDSRILIPSLIEAGLQPCMTDRHAKTFEKQTRWLDRQLTPIERTIRVGDHWEKLYEDDGMEASYPEVMKMWRARMRKMKISSMALPFQEEGLPLMLAKESLLLADVMGLGKTIQSYLAALLRGTKHILIVCPKKLMGTWQDDYDNVVLPWIRTVRKNWLGETIPTDPAHIIQYAEDCRPENLKLFNLIGFDTLKSTPKDGQFFRCPKCGFVVYRKRKSNDPMYCPGNPKLPPERQCDFPYIEWRKACRERDDAGYLKYRKRKIDLRTGNAVHWNAEIPLEYMMIDDGRESIETRYFHGKPDRVRMEEQDSVFKKMVVTESTLPDGRKTAVAKERPFHASWTFADLLRGKFNLIIVDEILYVANPESKRSRAFRHLSGRHRIGLTGTPQKGMPQSILAYWNWIADRSVLKDYREYDGGVKRFLDRYRTDVYIGGKVVNGKCIGGKAKQIPVIKEPTLFQAEFAPLMLRRIRDEPKVIYSIPKKTIEMHNETLAMDPTHAAWYARWIELFAEWWATMKEEEEGKKTSDMLVVKMMYLLGASCNPHNLLDNILKSKDETIKRWASIIGVYRGPPTAKELYVRQLVMENYKRGDKTLVGTIREAPLLRGKAWSTSVGIPGMVVNGATPLTMKPGETRSQRHQMVMAFNDKPYGVMWCGMKALAEGMNIPSANHGVIMDFDWEPMTWAQFIGRMLRMQQTKTVHQWSLMHKGTIDEYVYLWQLLKWYSHQEGTDYQTFDFDSSMVPDIQAYAQAICDGTEEVIRRSMWSSVDSIKQAIESGEESIGDEDYSEED